MLFSSGSSQYCNIVLLRVVAASEYSFAVAVIVTLSVISRFGGSSAACRNCSLSLAFHTKNDNSIGRKNALMLDSLSRLMLLLCFFLIISRSV